MSRKLYAAFAPLLAIAAFVLAPAVAQAQPHWYSNGVRLPETGAKTAVTTKGELDLEALESVLTCKAKDKGTIDNPANGKAGEDSITEFSNTGCVANPAVCTAGETLTLIASRGGNPLSATNEWPTILEETGGVIRDRISEIEIKIECNGVVKATFTGTLTPRFVNSGAPKTCEGATDSFVEFDEPGSGHLIGPLGAEGFPSGKDFIEGPAGDRCITVQNP
ncbi:MAG: hypothetical protein ACRDK7_04910 [Solirubrobacteraceae bacterium]